MEAIFHLFTQPTFDERLPCVRCNARHWRYNISRGDTCLWDHGAWSNGVYQVIFQVTTQNQETPACIVGILRREVPREGHLWIGFHRSWSKEYKIISDGSSSSKTFPVIFFSSFLSIPSSSHSGTMGDGRGIEAGPSWGRECLMIK